MENTHELIYKVDINVFTDLIKGKFSRIIKDIHSIIKGDKLFKDLNVSITPDENELDSILSGWISRLCTGDGDHVSVYDRIYSLSLELSEVKISIDTGSCTVHNKNFENLSNRFMDIIKNAIEMNSVNMTYYEPILVDIDMYSAVVALNDDIYIFIDIIIPSEEVDNSNNEDYNHTLSTVIKLSMYNTDILRYNCIL